MTDGLNIKTMDGCSLWEAIMVLGFQGICVMISITSFRKVPAGQIIVKMIE